VSVRPLAISTGDPGGVGPEVALRAAAALGSDDRCLLFGDARALRERAIALGIQQARLHHLERSATLELPQGGIGFVDTGRPWDEEAVQHAATPSGGAAQLAALDGAIEAARSGAARAIVTAPMSKHAVHLAGHAFIGHTEHLARGVGLADDDVTMMFLGPRLRVALVTTHLSIRELPEAITPGRVLRTIVHLAEAVQSLASGETGVKPLVLVTGLNPHAGEAGLFGDEELRSIAPAIERARAQPPFADGQVRLAGPLGAETAFRQAASDPSAAVVAMAHDQATIASKLLDWTQAVNVTWGLPFVRTSVDHGVAYDAAAAGTADARGMLSALAMAQRLTQGSS
jgi:4-phospho-D-threonate 3-dehydrogenase / 4-phospho-D-erythronate 3-dehydrogenase